MTRCTFYFVCASAVSSSVCQWLLTNQAQQTFYRVFKERDAPTRMRSICDDVPTHTHDVVSFGFSMAKKTAEVGDLGLPLRLFVQARGLPLRRGFKNILSYCQLRV